ncbi:MAG: hypothetical protein LBP74_08245, partial [Treponema sp.]|nr:hypothetical protein [Treponema sp.]
MSLKLTAGNGIKPAAALVLLLLLAACEPYGKVGGDDTNIQGALPDLLRGEWAYIPPGSDIPSE